MTDYEYESIHRDLVRAGGETFEIERSGRVVQTADGKAAPDRRSIRFLFKDGVQVGDTLRGTKTGQTFYVTDVQPMMFFGAPRGTREICESEVRRRERLESEQRQASFTINANTVQGSIIGNQQNANVSNTTDLITIYDEIDRRGGDDAEELKEMVNDLIIMLESQESINRGSLARFSAAIERHSWIAGAVAQTMLGWLSHGLSSPGV